MSFKEKFSAAQQGVKKGLSKAFNAVTADETAFEKKFEKKHPIASLSALTAFDLAFAGFGIAAAVTTGGIAVPVLGGALAFLAGANAVQDGKKLKRRIAQKKKHLPPSNGF